MKKVYDGAGTLLRERITRLYAPSIRYCECCFQHNQLDWMGNLLERDGRRFTIRPEKIRLLEPGEPHVLALRFVAQAAETAHSAGLTIRVAPASANL